jgi:hypothetical protein
MIEYFYLVGGYGFFYVGSKNHIGVLDLTA